MGKGVCVGGLNGRNLTWHDYVVMSPSLREKIMVYYYNSKTSSNFDKRIGEAIFYITTYDSAKKSFKKLKNPIVLQKKHI